MTFNPYRRDILFNALSIVGRRHPVSIRQPMLGVMKILWISLETNGLETKAVKLEHQEYVTHRIL